MLWTSQNIPSIFKICFDIKLANTTHERSTEGLWSNAFNMSKHHFEETKFYAYLKIIKLLNCHIYSFLKDFAYNFALKMENSFREWKRKWKIVLNLKKGKKLLWN